VKVEVCVLYFIAKYKQPANERDGYYL